MSALVQQRRSALSYAWRTPCSIEKTWNSLQERGRLYHRAALRAGERGIEVLLTAFPIGVPARQVAQTLAKEIG